MLTRTIALALGRSTRNFIVLVLAIQMLVVIVLAIINGNHNDPVTASVWEWPGVVWIRYPVLGFGAALANASLVPFLANGVTRRQYLRGAALCGVGVCAVTALIGVIGYVTERAAYSVAGFETDITPYSPSSMLVVYLLLLTTYLVQGSLIGAAYFRWSPLRATSALLVFVLPIVATEILLGTWWSGIARPEGDPREAISLAISAPLVIVVIAVAAAAAFVLLRDIAIKPKKG